jgi:hypothetical protein
MASRSITAGSRDGDGEGRGVAVDDATAVADAEAAALAVGRGLGVRASSDGLADGGTHPGRMATRAAEVARSRRRPGPGIGLTLA